MATGSSNNAFEHFRRERRSIVNEIEQFLIAVIKFCYSIEERQKKRKLLENVFARMTERMSRNLHSVIKSLSFIHGLYGYPDCSHEDVRGSVFNIYITYRHLFHVVGEGRFCCCVDIIMATEIQIRHENVHRHKNKPSSIRFHAVSKFFRLVSSKLVFCTTRWLKGSMARALARNPENSTLACNVCKLPVCLHAEALLMRRSVKIRF